MTKITDDRLAEIEDRAQDAAVRGQACDEMDTDEIISLVVEVRALRSIAAHTEPVFVEWVRNWAKRRFGKWITHNTAKGAFNDFEKAMAEYRGETKL